MRILISSLLSIGGLMLLAAPSMAQEFAGPHIEATVGWNHNNNAIAFPGGSDGLLYGGGAGYDLRFGRLVTGVEGEVTGTTGKTCVNENGIFPGSLSIAGRSCGRTGRSIFAGARLGYVAADRTLLYALGGYANVRRRMAFDGTVNGAQSHSIDNVDRDGYRIGAGIEQSIASHAFVRAEYRYTHTGENSKLNQNQVVTSLGWRF